MINSSKNGRFATFVHDLCPASLVFLSSEHYLCTAVQRYAKLLDYADTIAERIAQLGGTAYGTSQLVAQNSSLAEYPTDISSTDEHLSALLERYATLANAVRKVVEDGMTDEGTANFLTDASNDLDKYLWFIESNLATA